MKLKDESWLASLNLNIGIFYFNLKKTQLADQYIEQAVKHVQKMDDPYTELCTWQIRSVVKSELKEDSEALQSIRKACSIATQSENPDWQIRCIPSLTRYFDKKKQQDSVRFYIDKGNELIKQLPSQSIGVFGFIQSRSSYNFNNGNYKEALKDFIYLKQTSYSGITPSILYKDMAVCYQQLGNYPQAYSYMDSARIFTDSLGQQELTKKMAELNEKFKNQEQKLEIVSLHEKNQAQHIVIMKIITVAVILLSFLIIYVFYLHNKKKHALAKVEKLQKEKELAEAKKYIEGLENERKRLAKELHDGIANDLLGLQFMLDISDKQQLNKVLNMVNEIREHTRQISHELMPPEFKQFNLNDILTNYLRQAARYSGLSIQYDPQPDIDWKQIPEETSYEIYRIIQELITNTIKHSTATQIAINLNTRRITRIIYLHIPITENNQKKCHHPMESEVGPSKTEHDPSERNIKLRQIKRGIYSHYNSVRRNKIVSPKIVIFPAKMILFSPKIQ